MSIRLSILPFLQRWDGAALDLRVLVVPRGNPLDPLIAGQPAFADAPLAYEVALTTGLDALPVPGGAAVTVRPPVPPRPQARALFAALAAQFPIDPAPPPVVGRRPATFVKKHAPASYRAAAQFDGSRTPFVVADDSYSCAMQRPRTPSLPPPPPPRLSWGRVIAIALRQPRLAEALGLIVPLRVPLTPADVLRDGGYVHVAPLGIDLSAEPDAIRRYAARTGPLVAPRPLFTPVVFPVAATPGGSYDELFAEATSYDDGFAKIVHGAQPRSADLLKDDDDGSRPPRDVGIRLGWDDEQVAIWLNRQIDPTTVALDAPLGVSGYRIDARSPGDATWQSLCRGRTTVAVGALSLGTFDDELSVQTHPVQLDGGTTGDFWLPMYYTSWTGPSLVGRDTVLHELNGIVRDRPDLVVGLPPDLRLRYGKDFEFRVRLVDQTGGSAALGDAPAVAGPAPSSTVRFLRWVRPRRLRVDDTADDAASITVRRPRLPYPQYAFASDAPDPIADLRADVPAANAERREVGLPDPDATQVLITVQVQCPAFDPAGDDDGYQTLYTATRAFPDDPAAALAIDLAWTDAPDALAVATAGAATGPLPVPTARQVRIQLQPLCRDAAGYYGADDVRRGPSSPVLVRRDASDERALFAPATPAERLVALYLQPDAPPDANQALAQRTAGRGVEAATDAVTRLAAELHLVADGLTLRGRPGSRVAFGAAAGLRCVIAPDGGGIAFASRAELVQHWLVVLRTRVARDWTWDGLGAGLTVERDGAAVGVAAIPRAVSGDAIAGAPRDHTEVIFFDTVDPKPDAGGFPDELHLRYKVGAQLRGGATGDPPDERTVRLPITTPPAQRPRLVSAGIALSPYRRSPDYASTEPRDRALWIELDRQPDNPRDAYFVRLLRYAPDPLLVGPAHDLAEAAEPPLPIDPEPLRAIVEGQSDDRAGLDAMLPLIPSSSPVHYLLPLPPGVHPDSPELFGFFSYELRAGHRDGWSTARGRFGPALRVTGVQHPAPALACQVERTTEAIRVTAPYARPVIDHRSLLPNPPRTDLWFVLYAQVEQADGADRRNVLLGRKLGHPSKQSQRTPEFAAAAWTAAEVRDALHTLAFPLTSPLSCLAVEMLPNGNPVADGLGANLGAQRVLRTSPLAPIPVIC